MITKVCASFLVFLALVAVAPAEAGWYEIKNYVGTVGSESVHVSLQTFNWLNRSGSGKGNVDGSYYYDAHRIPIPLQGRQNPDGHIVLCEASAPRLSNESPIVAAASLVHPVPCPITLTFANGEGSGEWNDTRRVLPISLHQVGSLDDTNSVFDKDRNGIRLEGTVEIPMWYHTKRYLLLGIYQSSSDCPLSMLSLRLVNIATGKVDKDIILECDAGMIMTSIYANIDRARTPNYVGVEFQGGRMGYYKELYIGPLMHKQKWIEFPN